MLRLVLQVLFFSVLALLVAWGVRELIRRRITSAGGTASSLSPARLVRAGEGQRELLPADVPAAALELWDAGERERALGLLYRGALAFLAARLGLTLRDADTEGECLALVRRRAPGPRADAFARLIRSWQEAAFAHRAPTREAFLELIGLWRRSFADGAAAAREGAAS
jgi:hypothetical protein